MIYDKGGVTIRVAEQRDVDALKGRLRREDVEEVLAAGFKSEGDALDTSFQKSVASFTVEREGVPVAMGGVVPEESYLGASAWVWFLGSDDISRMGRMLAKLTRPMLGDLLSLYPVLFNYVDIRYKKTVSWLKHFGARFDEPLPIGANGLQFAKFTITREALWARRPYQRR